jgi:hypothetical protein
MEKNENEKNFIKKVCRGDITRSFLKVGGRTFTLTLPMMNLSGNTNDIDF